MTRKLNLTRDDGELLVELLDTVRGKDMRLDIINDDIREMFGMVTYEQEQARKQQGQDTP